MNSTSAEHVTLRRNEEYMFLLLDSAPYFEESYRLGLIDAMTEIYDIRVKGHLDSSWTTYFHDLQMTRLGDGTTRLFGPILDQPALLGLLMRIASLGLPILVVKNLDYACHKGKRKKSE